MSHFPTPLESCGRGLLCLLPPLTAAPPGGVLDVTGAPPGRDLGNNGNRPLADMATLCRTDYRVFMEERCLIMILFILISFKTGMYTAFSMIYERWWCLRGGGGVLT